MIKINSNTIANYARLYSGRSSYQDRMKCTRYLLGEMPVKGKEEGVEKGKQGLQIITQIRPVKETGRKKG